MDKEEIAKILSKYIWFEPIEHVDVNDEQNDKNTKELIDTATSSLTALIIKWLESKRKQVRYEDVKREMGLDGVIIEREKHITYNKEEEACNQLITELIGEVR